MPDVVFWDTSAFVALGNRDDDLHPLAVAISEDLARQKARILTTDAVLVEVVNSFSKVPLRPFAQTIVDAVQQSARAGVASVVHVDEDLWRRGLGLFTQRPDKEWSLTDCISIVVMQERRVLRAFTSDHHFEQAGFVGLMAGASGAR